MKYCLGITHENLDLVTFLNDGVRPVVQKDTFLVCEVNGPTEITTKIMSLEEMNTELRSDQLHEVL